jgi:hypothetical protein
MQHSRTAGQAEKAHLLGLPDPQTLHLSTSFCGVMLRIKVCATKVAGVEDLKTQIRDVITTCWLAHGKN